MSESMKTTLNELCQKDIATASTQNFIQPF